MSTVSSPAVVTSTVVQYVGPGVMVAGPDDGSGTVGFYGTAPIAQQTVAVAASDAATTQALANSLRSALIALGLVA